MSDTTRRASAPDFEGRAAAVADSSSPPAVLPRDVMAEIFAHARECYPEECCGLLLGEEDGPARHVVRCTNVQSQRFSKGESQLDAGRGFWIDAQELQEALRVAEEGGEKLRMVYHSHVDTGAYLSQTDLLAATAADGSPLWPGVGQIVVSVYDDRVGEAVLFDWQSDSRTFAGRAIREEG